MEKKNKKKNKLYLIRFICGDYEEFVTLAKTKTEVIQKLKKRGIRLSEVEISKLDYELL